MKQYWIRTRGHGHTNMPQNEMTPELWGRVKVLFEAALNKDPGERAVFLDIASGGDRALRAEVERLISHYEQAGDFIEKPAFDLHAPESHAFATTELLAGRYRIIRFIGQGGMGEVYQARDLELEVSIALKTVRPALTPDAQTLARFKREIQLARKVTHPNVCRIFDIGRHRTSQQQEILFLTMELLSGETLAERLGRAGPFPTQEALPLVEQMAKALSAAHRAKIIHRDFKSSNVMLVAAGDEGTRVVVMDFGLAQSMAHSQIDQSTLTLTGQAVGTRAYMAPEQFEGADITAAADIYSFGIVMYEIVTGQRPFRSNAQILKLPPPSPRIHLPELDHKWEQVILQCLQPNPADRFASAEDVTRALKADSRPLRSTHVRNARTEPSGRHSGAGSHVTNPANYTVKWRLAGAIALLASVAGIAWWLSPHTGPEKPLALVRLTSDSGLASDGVVSPDGKLLAYSSDRSGDGNMDIWIQQMAGGEPLRLTHHEADDTQPSFSPDGSKIVFRSDRDGGGIFLISAMGGDERLLAKDGYNPRFSPNGMHIVYWTGDPANAITNGKLYVVPSEGGPPQTLQPGFRNASFPIWSPDGEYVLFEGIRAAGETSDWWITPVHAGGMTAQYDTSPPAVKTGALPILREQELRLYLGPGAWVRGRVYFSARLGQSRNLWEIAVSPKTLKASAPLRRLTVGSGVEVLPFATTDGRLVFSSYNLDVNIWRLRMQSNSQRIRERWGEDAMERVTHGVAYNTNPSISSDGNKLVFVSQRSGRKDVWLKDLAANRETALTITPWDESSAIITPDGSKVAYSALEKQKRPIHVVATTGGVAEKVCADCGDVLDWSQDGKKLLYSGFDSSNIGLLDMASGETTTILQNSRYSFSQAHFSLDERWIVFAAGTNESRPRIFIVPWRKGAVAGPSDWIAITEGSASDDKPRWSPSGDAIYYYSKRDGFGCIWKQTLNPRKQPLGPSSPVHHFHTRRLSMAQLFLPWIDISIARDQLVVNLLQMAGNLWMTQIPVDP